MEALLSIVVSNAVLATLLAAFAAVAARLCRRPMVCHALWLLVLLKLITPPLLLLSVNWPRSEEVELPSAKSPPAVELAPVPAMSEPIASDEEINPTSPQRQQGERSRVSAPSERPLGALTQPRSPLLALRAGEVLIVGWLGGALAWWTVAAVRLAKFRRLLRQARPAPEEVRDRARRLAELLGMRRCPPIVFVSAPLSPMLWALGLSPCLLVPAELWRKLTAEQQDTLLAHELAHLRRGDHWVRRLEFLVLGLYWWHPIAWWARRRLQEAEEECCDALVLAVLPDAAEAYASALFETVTFLSQTRLDASFGASGAGHVPLLKRRLTMILTETSPRKRSRIAFWMVLGLGALLLPLAPRAARTEAPEELQGEKDKDGALKFELPFVKAEGNSITMDFGFPLVNPHKNEQQFCLACHQAQTIREDRLHGKPESWRHAHDEIVRLMDEIRQRQAQLRELAKGLPVAAKPDRSEEIEKVLDEIELLKVQVRLKEARVAGAKRLLAEHQRRLSNYQELNRRHSGGVIPTDTINEVKLAVATQETQVQINVADLEESQVRIRQAESRLSRLQGSSEKRDKGGPTPQEKRLQELEQNVEKLLKEIRDLRRQMQPEKPGSKREGQGMGAQREKRMLRWLLLFDTHNGEDYVAQLRGVGAILAIPVGEDAKGRKYKIVRDLKARPAKLEDEDITKIQRIYWVDDKAKSVGDVLAALDIRLPAQPEHLIAFMPEELENKLYGLESEYLSKHHPGNTEDKIIQTKFRIKRSGSSYEPEVTGLSVK